MGDNTIEYLKFTKLKLKECKGNYNKLMFISEELRVELPWWITKANSQFRAMHKPPIDLTIFTDSSNLAR